MAPPTIARANPALRLAFLRRLHVYISVFVAPSLLFFAVTGALQTFRIPDQKTAPVLIQKLARVHKDDVFAVKPARPKRPEGGPKSESRDDAGKAPAAGDGGEHRHRDHVADADGPKAKAPGEAGPPAKPPAKPSTEVLKWFFAAVSSGIAITTLIGVWMALAYQKRKLVMWLVLAAGALTPILILAF